MSDGTRGAPKGVDNELPDSKKPLKECPYCGTETNTLPNHLRYQCEVVNDDS
jgi:hypothetical protein